VKPTLLDICQEILSSMDSDEINSLSDTVEAGQVAMIVRRVYLDLCARLNLNEHFDLFQLTASGDPALPIVMYRPETVDQILWLKYDMRLLIADPVSFQNVTYTPPSTFFDRMFMMNSSEDNVETATLDVDGDSFTLLYRTDRHPSHWTSLDDSTLIFDSHLLTLDTTLQKSKTNCYGLMSQTFDITDDDFIPNLDAQQFPLLINEAKALAWAELKQATHARAEREARRQHAQTQKNKRAVPSTGLYPNYNNVIGYGRK
jgi:hypothetical protein